MATINPMLLCGSDGKVIIVALLVIFNPRSPVWGAPLMEKEHRLRRYFQLPLRGGATVRWRMISRKAFSITLPSVVCELPPDNGD